MNENLQNNVIEAIKSGKAKMRPRWYFVLQTILGAALVLVTLAALLYFASFIIFVFQSNGGFFALGFGLGGWYAFFGSLPWTVLVLSLVLILILAILMNRYSFIYQRPSLYFLLVVIILVACGSFLLAATSFRTAIDQSYSLQDGVPVIGGFYAFEETPSFGDIHRGQVVALTGTGFVLAGIYGNTTTVTVPPALLVQTEASLQAGDFVIVFGPRDSSGVIEASGVERVSE
jgi:hypothetical protein